MRQIVTIFSCVLVLSLSSAHAQLCSNVVDGYGESVVSSNGLIVIAPNLGGADCGEAEADADGDGIADSSDECPHEAGPSSNGGCPELSSEELAVLKDALEGVQFKTDSDELIGDSNQKLDKVVGLLQKHPDFTLKISGYTDNTGDAEYNVQLSDKRAHAAESYIISSGISASRITAKGYGEENPVADNSTAAGRAKNRRVEFELIH